MHTTELDTLYPDGVTATEWVTYCRKRQRDLFPGDGELIHYTRTEPTTASIGELLKAKGVRIA